MPINFLGLLIALQDAFKPLIIIKFLCTRWEVIIVIFCLTVLRIKYYLLTLFRHRLFTKETRQKENFCPINHVSLRTVCSLEISINCDLFNLFTTWVYLFVKCCKTSHKYKTFVICNSIWYRLTVIRVGSLGDDSFSRR